MFHEYFGPDDIDPVRYETTFPHSDTNWQEVHDRLLKEEERMNFTLETMLIPLENHSPSE